MNDWRQCLIERDSEIDALGAAIAASRRDGRFLVVEGPAGIGKTRLLDGLRSAAGDATVFAARAGTLERDVAFGVAGQLFERPLARASDDERALLLAGAAAPVAEVLGLAPIGSASVPTDPARSCHALFWLVLNLAERGPVVLIVDDVHWADAASVQFLAYLARRLEGVPALVVLAARDGEPWSDEGVRAELTVGTQLIRPAALTPDGVGELAQAAFGAPVPPTLVDACHRATGGNPFFLGELVAALVASGRTPTEIPIETVRATVPATVARSILLRVGALGEDAVRLSKAAALLGDGAALWEAAAVDGLDVATAERAADALACASILSTIDPLRFVHPIVCAAVEGDTPPARRGTLHRRAAMVLRNGGAPTDRIVPHLLRATPSCDPWVVETLTRAGIEAAARGAPAAAVRCLRRAVDEPPVHDSTQLLVALSGAELAVGDYFASAASARRAVETAIGPAERARVRRLQSVAALSVEGAPAAVHYLEQGIEEATGADAELAMVLEGNLAYSAVMGNFRHPVLDVLLRHRHAPGATEGERSVLAMCSLEALYRGEPARAVRDLALRALAGGRLLAEESSQAPAYYVAVVALLAAEAWNDAAQAIAEGFADCQGRGLTFGYGGICWLRGLHALALGDLAAAEADERACVEHAVPTMVGIGAASLALVLLEQGDVAGAEEELARHGLLSDERPLFVWGPYVRALVRLAQGRHAEALTDLRAIERQATEVGGFVVGLPWRAHAALARHALGDVAGARAVAADDIARARHHGGAAALGSALRAAGLVADGDERLDLLTEAAAVLAPTPNRLALARVRYDLGVALLRAGRRREGREALTRSCDAARDCGAKGLAETAQHELLVAGARPRRLTFSGLDALTASERRVATMAAEGMTNREIAVALFVTPKTVENQLGHVYAKLGVNSRRSLRDVLDRSQS